MTSEHTFHPFDTDMGKLRGGVLRIAALVERLLVRAVKASLMQDQARAAQVIADDAAVHDLHAEIDAQAALTIARQQPTAGDLQEIVAVFHLIDDLERIGQESRRIARRVEQGEQAAQGSEAVELEAIAQEVADALRRSVDAFIHHDSAMAAAQRSRAEALEQRAQAMLVRLQAAMLEPAATLKGILAMNFVVQSISRSVSHTRHIAEYLERAFEGRPRRETGTI